MFLLLRPQVAVSIKVLESIEDGYRDFHGMMTEIVSELPGQVKAGPLSQLVQGNRALTSFLF